MDALKTRNPAESPALAAPPDEVEPGYPVPAGLATETTPETAAASGRGLIPAARRMTGGASSPSILSTRRMREGLASAVASERERGLSFLFVPVALGCGAGLYFSLPTEPGLTPFVVALAASAVFAFLAYGAGHRAAPILMLAAMFFAGVVIARLEMRNPPVLLDSDVTTSVTGRVLRAEIDDAGKVRYLLKVLDTSDPEIRRPPEIVRLVARAGHPPFPVGSLIAGRARLSSPSGPVIPGGYDFAFAAFTEGLGAYGFFFAPPVAVEETLGQGGNRGWRLAERVQMLRSAIAARVRSVVPGDAGAIAAALTVSDRRGISDAVVEELRATGLAHILAISGLHMALAAGIFYVGLRRLMALAPVLAETLPVKKIAAIGALAVSTAYLVISGAGVPTERAWLMMSIMMIAVIADRPALTMRNVAIAATLITLAKPSAVTTPGFQMSFAATAGLIAAYGAWARWAELRGGQGGSSFLTRDGVARRLAVGILGLMATSLVAGLATGLFSAYHFHRIAAYGLIANLLAMPLVTFVVMPAGLAAMLAMPFGLDAWPLRVMGLGLEGVMAVAHQVTRLGGDVVVGQMPTAATAIAAAGFIILVFLRSRLRLAGLVVMLVGLGLAQPPFHPPPPDILVSEDGRLVGLLKPGAFATNAARPGSFVFDQWRMAMRAPAHDPPVAVDRSITEAISRPAIGREPGFDAKPTLDPELGLDELIPRALATPGMFTCLNRGTCMALHRELLIAAIGDPAWIGPACDRAGLVIISVPVRITDCASGAMLVTARELRRTGALAVRVTAEAVGEGVEFYGVEGEGVEGGPTSHNRSGKNGASHQIRISPALGGVIRPWTVQRYYDWRTGDFDLPPAAILPGVASLQAAERQWHRPAPE